MLDRIQSAHLRGQTTAAPRGYKMDTIRGGARRHVRRGGRASKPDERKEQKRGRTTTSTDITIYEGIGGLCKSRMANRG